MTIMRPIRLFGLGALAIVVLCLICSSLVYATNSIVQIPASSWDYLGGKDSPATWCRLGQRLTLNNTEVLAIGYRVCRVGSPTGNVTLSIRNSRTDHIVWSQVWGDASALPDANNSTYCIVGITPSVKVDGDVRICVEYNGGNATDYCQAGYYSGDKITGEWYTNYVNYATDASGWHDIGKAEEAAYYMLYVDKDGNPTNGGNETPSGINWWVIGAGAGIFATVLGGVAVLKRLGKRADNRNNKQE